MAKFWAINEEIMHYRCSNDRSNLDGYYDRYYDGYFDQPWLPS